MRDKDGAVIQQLLEARRRQRVGLSDGVDVVAWLEKGEITGCELLPWGSNYTFIAAVRSGGEEWFAIYKPRRGEIPLWDFPAGTLFRRECAAYHLAEALGWPRVPATVIRRGPLGVGSFQLYVDCDFEDNYFTFQGRHVRDAQRVAVFDFIANNADRKAGHLLLGADGHLWAIDHGLTFNAEPKLRTVIWEFAGQRVPDILLADVASIGAALETNQRLAVRLGELLSKRELEAVHSRVRSLVESPYFPYPTSQRSVPWPLV